MKQCAAHGVDISGYIVVRTPRGFLYHLGPLQGSNITTMRVWDDILMRNTRTRCNVTNEDQFGKTALHWALHHSGSGGRFQFTRLSAKRPNPQLSPHQHHFFARHMSSGYRYFVRAHCSLTAWSEWRAHCRETGRTLGVFLFKDILCQGELLCVLHPLLSSLL